MAAAGSNDPDRAELSSLASVLDDLVGRIDAIASRRVRADPDDPVAADLFEVERSLRSASRRMSRALRSR